MEKAVYINSVSAYLPNSPIANEDMEDYIGKIGGNPSRVRSIVLRQNGIKTRYYGLDKNQNLTHSNTGLVEAPILSYKPIDIVPIEIGTGKYELSADWRGTDYSARWTDRNGEDIGEGNKITVIPTSGNNEFSVTALSSQGEMAQESVTLESMIGFKSVTPTLIEDFINVELHNPVNSKNAMLQVSSLTQGGTVLLNKALPYDVKKTQLDATSLSSGMYILSYLVNGQIIDSKKFYKK